MSTKPKKENKLDAKDLINFILLSNEKLTVASIAKKFKVKKTDIETMLEESETIKIALEDSGKAIEIVLKECFDIAVKKLKLLIQSPNSEVSLDAIKELNKFDSVDKLKIKW